MDEFKRWKEQEEEDTYTTYVQRQKPYKPKTSESKLFFYTIINILLPINYYYDAAIIATYYYSCCRDGEFHTNTCQRKTEQKRVHQKDTRKLNDLCISRMYVTEFFDCHIEVSYISAHTGHELGSSELQFLPLPNGTKQAVAQKISLGIPTERIIDGNVFHTCERLNATVMYFDIVLQISERILETEQEEMNLMKLLQESIF